MDDNNSFGIHQYTESKTRQTVCEAVKSVLGPKYLNLQKCKKNFLEFEVWYDSRL